MSAPEVSTSERYAVRVDRPEGRGFRDTYVMKVEEYERILTSTLRQETCAGTVLRGIAHVGPQRVRTLVEGWHDGERWHFKEEAPERTGEGT